MKTLDSLDKVSDRSSPFVVTIGNFDGVHLGHQKLLRGLKGGQDQKSLVVTFDPHPVEFFDRSKTFRKLFSNNYQNQQMNNLGIDYLVRLEFDKTIATMNYDRFLDLLATHVNVKKVVIGHDLKIGKDRKGDQETIRSWCLHKGIEFQVVDPLFVEGQVVSTTFIKSLVEAGKFSTVPLYLGRSYSIDGIVIHGDKRGRQIGFPTANLTCPGARYLPHFGVYQTQTIWQGHRYSSITNVGRTPTFKEDDLVKIETHIFDFDRDIYGERINVEFEKFIRPEKKFSGIEEIKNQIALDIASIGRGKLK